MRVYHMNGCGNRFAIFDTRLNAPFRPSAEEIRRIAHPVKDQEFDQIIGMEASLSGDVFMRIWNADGSEVKACGNATRCVGSLILNETGKEEISIETEAGRLKAFDAGKGEITVDMGSPLLSWEHIPLSEKMDTRGVDVKIGPIDDPILSKPACVNMGNPHATFFVKDVADYDIPAIGPLVEWHPVFPEGVNVGFAQVIDKKTIRLRVWERGAGLTLACGTGACATLVNAVRLKKTGRKAKMILDGGELTIEWRKSDDKVLMTGPVELEAQHEV
jgi:diaminopimelate epimerase